MSVFIDGSTLSSLLYSHANSAGNQEGVLLGQVVEHTKDHISDSQINNSQTHTFICIASHIPWPSEERVYSRGGVPIMEKLAALLGDNHKHEEVVGWYSFRRNSGLRMSMKERTLHKHLEARFSPSKTQQFVFFMCVDFVNTHCSTHSMDHFVATVSEGSVKKLAMTVTNLGDTLHTQYKTLGNSGATQSAAVRAILGQFRGQFVSSATEMQEVKRINDMSGALNSDLLRLCKQVAESEHKTGELEREVIRLKVEVAEMEEQQQLKQGKQGDSGTDTGKLYPNLPSDSRAWTDQTDVGPTMNKGETEETLMVQRGQDKEEAPDRPSVDDLLSMSCNAEVLKDNRSTQPAGGSSLASSVPPNSSQDDVCVTNKTQPSSTLQSVVDTITDTDEEETAAVSTSDHPRSDSDLMNEARKKESVGMNKVIKGKSGGMTRSAQAGAKQSKLSSDSSKSKDHFSFVDNLLTTEGGLSQRKTATVPTGATLTYSPRTTRSQAKGPSDPTLASHKDKLKARNAPASHSGLQSKRESSPKPDGKVKSTSVVSSTKTGYPSAAQDKRRGKVDKVPGSWGKDIRDGSQSLSKDNHPDSNTSDNLDPVSFSVGNRSKTRKNLSSKTVLQSGSDVNKTENGSSQNGNIFHDEEQQDVPRSLSPVF